jgi:hypothetical protein
MPFLGLRVRESEIRDDSCDISTTGNAVVVDALTADSSKLVKFASDKKSCCGPSVDRHTMISGVVRDLASSRKHPIVGDLQLINYRSTIICTTSLHTVHASIQYYQLSLQCQA